LLDLGAVEDCIGLSAFFRVQIELITFRLCAYSLAVHRMFTPRYEIFYDQNKMQLSAKHPPSIGNDAALYSNLFFLNMHPISGCM